MEQDKTKKALNDLNDILFKTDINSLVPINVHLINHNNMPAVQLRKISSDMEVIKQLTRAALNEQPIILFPKFNDKLKSINAMLEKGILYIEEGEYKFNF